MGFKKGVVTNPTGKGGELGGRPKKLINQLSEIDGLKPSQIRDQMSKLMEMDHDSLVVINEDPKASIFLRIVTGCLLKDMKAKTLTTLESLISRAHGAPTQHIEQNVKVEAKQEIVLPNGNIIKM